MHVHVYSQQKKKINRILIIFFLAINFLITIGLTDFKICIGHVCAAFFSYHTELGYIFF